MRQVVETKRTKDVYNISIKELKKGDWLKKLPDSDLCEFSFKNNFLIIKDVVTKKLDKSEKEGGDDGKRDERKKE